MKILYHHRTLGDGAEGIHIKEMVNAFRKLGHEVRVIGPIGEPKEKNNTRSGRRTFFSTIRSLVPRLLFELLEVAYNLYGLIIVSKEVLKRRPDFIYDRYMIFNASCILAGKLFKIPVMLEVNAPLALERSEEVDEKLYLKKLAFFLEKWICSHSFKTIVVSTPLKNYLESIGVPSKKIVVLPNGVDPEKFKPSPHKDAALLKKYGFSDDDVIVGFVGILRPWHGLDLLIDAFSAAKEKEPKLKLLIVGDGPIRSDIERKIEKLGLSDDVCITGRVKHDEIVRYINLFDIAVSPKATFYASPMKILEYMALGKAIIAPDMENIKDILEDKITGLLFNFNSKSDLNLKLINLIINDQLRNNIGQKARRRILDRLNWKYNAQKIIKLYT